MTGVDICMRRVMVDLSSVWKCEWCMTNFERLATVSKIDMFWTHRVGQQLSSP